MAALNFGGLIDQLPHLADELSTSAIAFKRPEGQHCRGSHEAEQECDRFRQKYLPCGSNA
ncbi:hypothetical protein ACFYO5_32125 [Streptomyces sp. NPDC006259]|uniref:hypothetical protein n=1 Tax=Streptomyces sp. NPDC006259 TaxID=3364740 RepID=UPI00369028FE